ncbi:MAG: HEPN domain-containing protein [Thermodesulfovibrionales bacterium]|nr:HEPN domain-containing protein [Thermodesulfovibrionales bacterium]
MKWLEEADKKIRAGEILLKENHYDSSCLMSYLAAHISLYQLIEEKEQLFSNPSLVYILKKFSEAPSEILHSAKVLETYSLPLRMPSSIPEGVPSEYIDKTMAEEALRHAKTIMEFVKREMG